MSKSVWKCELLVPFTPSSFFQLVMHMCMCAYAHVHTQTYLTSHQRQCEAGFLNKFFPLLSSMGTPPHPKSYLAPPRDQLFPHCVMKGGGGSQGSSARKWLEILSITSFVTFLWVTIVMVHSLLSLSILLSGQGQDIAFKGREIQRRFVTACLCIATLDTLGGLSPKDSPGPSLLGFQKWGSLGHPGQDSEQSSHHMHPK